jgi:integrase
MEREVRVRVGKSRRVECMFPMGLLPAQLSSRRALVDDLAASLRHIEDPKGVSASLLTKLIKARETEEVRKLEKAIRRFISEPASAPKEPSSLVTFGEFGLHWATGGLADEYPRFVRKLAPKTMSCNIGKIKFFQPIIGHIALVKFTLADAMRALDDLPDAADSDASFRHYAQVIQTVIRRAVNPAGIIAADKYPLGLKFLPPLGSPPSYPILYPEDVGMLLSSKKLEAWKRMLYGFAIYEGMRISHMLRLRWGNIDWKSGTITVGIGKNNKNARTWELNAGTLAALTWFRGDAPLSDYIFPRLTDPEIVELSETLRNDLVTAGVTRDIHPDLYKHGDGQMPLRFHDLRATFVSLHLAMGWTETDVMNRTQHTSTKVLHHHYARRVGLAQSIIRKQGPLPPFDACLGLKGGGKGGGKKRGGN